MGECLGERVRWEGACACAVHRQDNSCPTRHVSRWSVCRVVVDMSELLPPSAPIARAAWSQQHDPLCATSPFLPACLPACLLASRSLSPPGPIISRSPEDRESDTEINRDRQNLTQMPHAHRSILRPLREYFHIPLSSALRARVRPCLCVRACGRAGVRACVRADAVGTLTGALTCR